MLPIRWPVSDKILKSYSHIYIKYWLYIKYTKYGYIHTCISECHQYYQDMQKLFESVWFPLSCEMNRPYYINGGVHAEIDEFPHMVSIATRICVQLFRKRMFNKSSRRLSVTVTKMKLFTSVVDRLFRKISC